MQRARRQKTKTSVNRSSTSSFPSQNGNRQQTLKKDNKNNTPREKRTTAQQHNREKIICSHVGNNYAPMSVSRTVDSIRDADLPKPRRLPEKKNKKLQTIRVARCRKKMRRNKRNGRSRRRGERTIVIWMFRTFVCFFCSERVWRPKRTIFSALFRCSRGIINKEYIKIDLVCVYKLK